MKIKSYVRYLKFMNDIEEVSMYHDKDHLIREFNKLNIIINKSLAYF